MASTVIKGGTVVTADLTYAADVKIEGGKIVVDAAVIEGHAQPYVIYEGGEMQRVASDE